jgi:hypothetical protein
MTLSLPICAAPCTPSRRPSTTTRRAPWMIDGTWYLAAASTGFEIQLFGDRGADITDDVLAAEVTTDGSWRLLFLQPPPEVRQVMWNLNGDNGGFGGMSRPT